MTSVRLGCGGTISRPNCIKVHRSNVQSGRCGEALLCIPGMDTRHGMRGLIETQRELHVSIQCRTGGKQARLGFEERMKVVHIRSE